MTVESRLEALEAQNRVMMEQNKYCIRLLEEMRGASGSGAGIGKAPTGIPAVGAPGAKTALKKLKTAALAVAATKKKSIVKDSFQEIADTQAAMKMKSSPHPSRKKRVSAGGTSAFGEPLTPSLGDEEPWSPQGKLADRTQSQMEREETNASCPSKVYSSVSSKLSGWWSDVAHLFVVSIPAALGKLGSMMKNDTRVIMAENPYMFNPASFIRIAWDGLIVLPLLIYLSVTIPYRLCFVNEPEPYTALHTIDVCVEVAFLLDIIINFRTGYFIEGIGDDSIAGVPIEYHPKSVAGNYIRTWFSLDAVSAIPFACIELLAAGTQTEGSSMLKILKSLRMLRFLKIARPGKIKKVTSGPVRELIDQAAQEFVEFTGTRSLIRIIGLGCQLAAACHYAACLYVFVGRDGSLREVNNWLAEDMNGPFTHEDTERGPNVNEIYLSAFYFTITTVTSVGYGDIITYNNIERIFTIGLEFFGGFVFALIIANLTSVVQSMDASSRVISEQLDAVSTFIQGQQFPVVLARRVRKHFRHLYARKSAVDENRILKDLSASLRRDVSVYIVSVRLADVKLFQTMNPKLWPLLLPLLNPTHFDAKEPVCTQGQECNEMLIILEGRLTGETTLEGYEDIIEQLQAPGLTNEKTQELKKKSRDSRKRRRIGAGDSVNVLCMLSIWDRSIETIESETMVESYALRAADFSSLFDSKNESDQQALEDIVARELQNFKMDMYLPAPTRYGVPLFMTFNCVEVTIVSARDILGSDYNMFGQRTSDPYVIVDVVHHDTRRQINRNWQHRTPSIQKTLDPVWPEKNSVTWKDIHLPFDQLALRIRLYDEDMMDADDELGEVFIRVSDLDLESGVCPFVKSEDKKSAEFKKKELRRRSSMAPTGNWNELNRKPSFMKRLAKVVPGGANDDASKKKTMKLAREAADALEQLEELENNVLDHWYDLKHTEEMLEDKEVASKSLGQIRIKTWVKRSESNVEKVHVPLSPVSPFTEPPSENGLLDVPSTVSSTAAQPPNSLEQMFTSSADASKRPESNQSAKKSSFSRFQLEEAEDM